MASYAVIPEVTNGGAVEFGNEAMDKIRNSRKLNIKHAKDLPHKDMRVH